MLYISVESTSVHRASGERLVLRTEHQAEAIFLSGKTYFKCYVALTAKSLRRGSPSAASMCTHLYYAYVDWDRDTCMRACCIMQFQLCTYII